MVQAAEFYSKTAKRSAMLDLVRIDERRGERTRVDSFPVDSKRHARALAEKYGFTPWNF